MAEIAPTSQLYTTHDRVSYWRGEVILLVEGPMAPLGPTYY